MPHDQRTTSTTLYTVAISGTTIYCNYKQRRRAKVKPGQVCKHTHTRLYNKVAVGDSPHNTATRMAQTEQARNGLKKPYAAAMTDLKA
eukprot:m.232898 g.232898  ORF g.232898 m.232898 type:complete len:88 (-) comp15239_c0_seq2:667-930(-)